MVEKLERDPLPMVVFLAEKVGLRDAHKVAGFIVSWGRASESMGRTPTVRGYSTAAEVSLPTTTRLMRLFHKAYPEEKNPQRVWESVRDEVNAVHREMAAAEVLAGRMVVPDEV
jgi:hypothetical protein